MTTLVTGGTGVVGGAVIRHLVAAGRTVRALSRNDTGDETLRRLGAEPVRGDVLQPESLVRVLDGADVAYHLAGMNTFCLSDPEPMIRANVDGSTNLMTAAARCGVRRVVYTSSAATLGEPAGTVGDERSPHRGWYLSAYERSKHLAEEAVLAAGNGVEVVSVNPSSVQGPGRATGTGKIILDLINGKLPALVQTRLSMVDIEDCARGHLLAEARGVSGERYVLNGFTVTIDDAVGLLSEALGRPISARYVPGWVAMAGAAAVEGIARLRSRRPKVCREMVRTMLHGHAYDGSRATRELGLQYTAAADTVRRLVEWLRGEGLIAG